MKKMYEKPMAFEEAFVADEYVAACYFLACKRGSDKWDGNADKWGGVDEYGYGISHSPLGTPHTCGDKNVPGKHFLRKARNAVRRKVDAMLQDMMGDAHYGKRR